MTADLSAKLPADATAIRNWMVAYISSVIDVQQDPFPEHDRFDNYGLDSVEITIMCGMMEEQFGLEVNPEEVFENPNVAALSAHLARRIGERAAAA
jgi:acyl carrier protein